MTGRAAGVGLLFSEKLRPMLLRQERVVRESFGRGWKGPLVTSYWLEFTCPIRGRKLCHMRFMCLENCANFWLALGRMIVC